MKWLSHIVALIIVNMIALFAAATYIPGFRLTTDFVTLLEVAAILTLLTVLVQPVLKLIFGPIIVLTLGLGIIIVHALVLVILDSLSKSLTIENVEALVYATLLIGIMNAIASAAFKNT
ncbi:MAG: phage holin family protein [Candidatus Liptonbacteria bacterium]|nr:phage holin family protein [Candidatus Liptonbacteria bacterium]